MSPVRHLFERLIPQIRPDVENTLAGHVLIELLHLLTLFLQANTINLLTTKVEGKRKREVGLVILAKFTAFAQELKNAKILKRELNERAYTHFELKNITIQLMKINSHRWLRTTLQQLQCIFIILFEIGAY